MGHPRRSFTPECKQEAVDLCRRSGKSECQVARELDIPATDIQSVAFFAKESSDRVVEENSEAIEIGPQAVEHDDVQHNDKEVARKRGVCLVQFAEEAPRDEQRQNFCFPRSRRHFQHVAWPVFIEHAGGHRAGRIEATQIVLLACLADFRTAIGCLDRLTLGIIIAERGQYCGGLRRLETTVALG